MSTKRNPFENFEHFEEMSAEERKAAIVNFAKYAGKYAGKALLFSPLGAFGNANKSSKTYIAQRGAAGYRLGKGIVAVGLGFPRLLLNLVILGVVSVAAIGGAVVTAVGAVPGAVVGGMLGTAVGIFRSDIRKSAGAGALIGGAITGGATGIATGVTWMVGTAVLSGTSFILKLASGLVARGVGVATGVVGLVYGTGAAAVTHKSRQRDNAARSFTGTATPRTHQGAVIEVTARNATGRETATPRKVRTYETGLASQRSAVKPSGGDDIPGFGL